MRRLVFGAAVLPALVACVDTPFGAPPGAVVARVEVHLDRQQLTVGETAAVEVRVFDRDGRRLELPVWAAVEARSSDSTVARVAVNGLFAAGPGTAEVIAEAGGFSGSAQVRVNPGVLTLLDPSVVINQAAQRTDGGVPLIAGRAGMLQVFLAADVPNFFDTPRVRVRLFRGTEEVAVHDLETAAVGVTARPFEEGASGSWNLPLPAELVNADLGILIEPDPDDRLPHASADRPRVFPASGEPLRFAFVEVPPLRIRFVPVHNPGIATGNVSEENVDEFLGETRWVFPLGEVDRDVRAPYSTPTHPTGDESWIRLLGEIGMLRAADGSDRLYVGIARTGGGGGRAALGSPVSVALDELPGAAWIVAHEIGHNFDRLHAGPCRPVDPFLDVFYPYAGGTIGSYGYDPVRGELFGGGSGFDVMGLCGNPIAVSDYTYEAVYRFRADILGRPAGSAIGAASTVAPVPTLLVWGRIDDRGVHLEPAFHVEAVPLLPAGPGAYSIEGVDEAGARLFGYRFEPTRISHAPEAGVFTFALPVDFPLDRLASVRVVGPRGSAEARSALRGGARQQLLRSTVPVAGERAARRPRGEVEIRWDAARHPAALVQDPRNGEVIGLARDGEARVLSDAPELELHLSDGVVSGSRRVRVR